MREAVGRRVAVIAKLNMADGVPGGLWLDESVEVARLLEADGALDALELTGGSSFENPMYLFRGEAPIAEMAQAFPRAAAARLPAHGEALHADVSVRGGVLPALRAPVPRRARDAADPARRRSTGSTPSQRALADGFEFVAMGRALLREPDLIDRWQQGDAAESLCVHCNKCMPTIYSGHALRAQCPS